MKHLLLPFVFLAACLTQASDFHAYRTTNVEPSYGLAKVKRLMKHLTMGDDDSTGLTVAQWNALSLREKFTYTMLVGEMFNQNCDAMPPVAHEDRKIFAFLPDAWEERTWSNRQSAFLKSNRKQVLGWIRETIVAHHRVGANMKDAIVETEGKELIPLLVGEYNRDHKDNDILTTMMLLMKNSNYGPFQFTDAYMKLYGDEDTSYKSYLAATPANARTIIAQAMAYYHSR